MKNYFILFFLSSSCFTYAQSVDTAAMRLEIDSLLEVNKKLVNEQKLYEALLTINEAKNMSLTAFGDESFEYAQCLYQEGMIYYRDGKYEKVEPIWLQCKSIRIKVLGVEDQGYSNIINGMAVLYSQLGKYDKAESEFMEALTITGKKLGKDHPDYAGKLGNLATLYYEIGKFEKAEPLFLEAKAIIENKLGKENAKYGLLITNLGNLYWHTAIYEKAESLYKEALGIYEKQYGRSHSEYAASLNRLALLYYQIGMYEESEILYLNAKEIWENSLGKDHPGYALVLNNLAILYYQLGQYQKVESFHLQTIKIREKVYGKNHTKYAESLTNLANLYKEFGNYEKAEKNYLEAMDIWKNTLGEDHHWYATSLENLANLYKEQKLYLKANKLYREAMDIRKATLGEKHPEYISIINNLGILLEKTNDFEEAESMLLKAKSLQENTTGPDHPNYALILNNLGMVYREIGNYEESENYFKDALNLQKNVLGTFHSDYTTSLQNILRLYFLMEKYDQATPYQIELFQNQKTQLINAFGFLSEKEKEIFIKTQIVPNIYLLQSLALHSTLPESQDLHYDLALLTKGVLLQTGKRTLSYILQQQDTISRHTYFNLLSVRRRLAEEYKLPISERNAVDELETQQEDLEKQLARLSSTFRQEQLAMNITHKEVKAALKPGEAAIEFIHFDYLNPDPTDSAMYAALVLLPDSDHAHFIPLFEEKQLDAILANTSERRLDYVDKLYSFSERGLVADEKNPSLYDLIWKPMDSLLLGVNTIYYSTAGLLNRLNIGAMPISEDTTLSDRFKLYTLSSTRQLALPNDREDVNKNALVYGGVEYNYDSTAIPSAIHHADSTWANSTGEGMFGFTDRSLRGGSWDYLKWTQKEATNIQQLLSNNGYHSSLLGGHNATEESFKQMGVKAASPRILHLATHGFFFPDPVDTLKHRRDEPIFKLSDHPMIRSGLILAGANRVWQGAGPMPGQEDGILTAYEISQMNLTNTELVVLSACETGLGDIKGNEGVFGLQRAFKMAGVKYLVMSLWQVPDAQTQDLMVTFYEKWLAEKMNIPDAFRAAQQEMREKYQNPYFWAGFVLLE